MQGMQVHMGPGRLGARWAEKELLIETREQIEPSTGPALALAMAWDAQALAQPFSDSLSEFSAKVWLETVLFLFLSFPLHSCCCSH